MLQTIIFKELRSYIISLRFYIMLLVALFLFGAGTVTSIGDYRNSRSEYLKGEQERRERVDELAENASRLAITRQYVDLSPRPNMFIADAREELLPSRFQYTAHNVWGFSAPANEKNPFIRPFKKLTWGFIVSLVISFAVLLFTYDALSGESESRTLAITLSNSVSRGMLLAGKYIAAIIGVLFILIPSVILSLIILLLTGTVTVTGMLAAEIGAFGISSLLFVACMVAFGLWSSVLVKHSRVSMIVALSLWIVFIVIVPYSTLFWSQTVFTIDSGQSVQDAVNSSRENINSEYTIEAQLSNDAMPFMPEHELHSERVMKIFNAEKQIRDNHFRQMLRQYETIRMIGYISPVSLFEQMNEAVVGGGYLRFSKAWDAMAGFQNRFLDFFMELDRNDPNSPHWYNYEQDISMTRQRIDPQTVPVFSEPRASFADRVSYAAIPAVLMILLTAVLFFIVYVMFVRYDVR